LDDVIVSESDTDFGSTPSSIAKEIDDFFLTVVDKTSLELPTGIPPVASSINCGPSHQCKNLH
jgi:hypothetical protein